MPRGPTLALALLLACAGCQQAPVVNITINGDAGLIVHQLIIDGTFATRTRTVKMPGTPSTAPLTLPQHASVILPSGAGGTLTITVHGTDAHGAVVASTSAEEPVTQGRAAPLGLTLAAPSPPDLAPPSDLAPPPDLAATDLAPQPCRPAAELCEDFESGALAPATWQTISANTTLTIDSSQPHRGRFALHVHADALAMGQNMAGLITERSFVPISSTPLFVRVWMRASAWPPLGPAHDAIIEAETSGPMPETAQLETSVAKLDFNEYVTGGMSTYQQSATVLPTGSWFCLEWQLAATSAATGLSRAWLDDAPLADMNVDNLPFGSFAVVKIGMDTDPTQSQPPIDLWLDDIAINSVYVPCAE
jgi:hypothetical protein